MIDHNTRQTDALSLEVQELESLEALTADGISSSLGACGVVVTVVLTLT